MQLELFFKVGYVCTIPKGVERNRIVLILQSYTMPWFYWLWWNGWLFCHRSRHNDRHCEGDLNEDCFWLILFNRNIYSIVSFKWELLFSIYMSIYFNIIGIRKYVIKKVKYNIGNTIPWACYQQWLLLLRLRHQRLEINRKTCEKNGIFLKYHLLVPRKFPCSFIMPCNILYKL